MNVQIAYSEITGFLGNKYNKKITLESCDSKTIAVSYLWKCYTESSLVKFIKEASVEIPVVVKLQIQDIQKDCIYVSYEFNNKKGLINFALNVVSGLVDGFTDIIRRILPAGVEVDTENRMIKLYPQQVAQLQKVLEYVSLSDVVFADDGMEVILSLA